MDSHRTCIAPASSCLNCHCWSLSLSSSSSSNWKGTQWGATAVNFNLHQPRARAPRSPHNNLMRTVRSIKLSWPNRQAQKNESFKSGKICCTFHTLQGSLDPSPILQLRHNQSSTSLLSGALVTLLRKATLLEVCTFGGSQIGGNCGITALAVSIHSVPGRKYQFSTSSGHSLNMIATMWLM